MQTTKLAILTLSGFLLTACDPNQMQVEGGSTGPTVGAKHSHKMPDGSVIIHEHGGDLSKSHTHNENEL